MMYLYQRCRTNEASHIAALRALKPLFFFAVIGVIFPDTGTTFPAGRLYSGPVNINVSERLNYPD